MPIPTAIVAAVLIQAMAVNAGCPAQKPASRPTLYLIPHTHWEGAVFLTREEYLDMGLSHILEALRLLEKFPDYKFALDQVEYFKPFLERYPEQAAAFRKYVGEGRLEIVGGMDIMPDEVKPGGELLVRQIQYGKGYCRRELGVDVDVAWLLDTFGHNPQMPQILKLGGFKSFWFCRGAPDDTGPSEFLWKGIDGSEIPACWLPGFYGLFYGPPRDLSRFSIFFKDRYRFLDRNARPEERVGLAGVDVSEPEDYVPPLVRQFNARPESPFTIRYSTPTEFAKVVAKRKDIPVKSYDLNPIFTGTFSSRIELKQAARAVEQRLLNAEKLGVIAGLSGFPSDDPNLWKAWEPVLFNQTHDLASGTMDDHVYVDTVRGYDFANQLADQMIAEHETSLASRIDTSGRGIPVVVFNPQGWDRSDVVEADLGFADRDTAGISLVGPGGRTTPMQITLAERYGDGMLKRVKVSFLARDVPALGYAVYHFVSGPANRENTSDGSSRALENEFYKVVVNPQTGEIASIVDKSDGSEALSGPANVIARSSDKGDLWELYHPLDGAMHLPDMTKVQAPDASSALLSTEPAAKSGVFSRGEVFSEFTVSHPFGSGQFSTRIRLAKGVKRIDIETTLINNERKVRYRALFPTTVAGGSNVQEIPFGAIERPVGIEYPAQNWVDYGNEKRGVALLNNGMAGNAVAGGTMMLSLMRSVNLGDYNNGDPSDTGFELGVQRKFRYSLVPHRGDWRAARIYRAGLDFNSPLLTFKASPHKGSLPNRWGFVSISDSNVVATSLQPGPHGTANLRLYEASGKATKGVHVWLGANVSSAVETNLLNDSIRRLPVRDGLVTVDMHPFEIKTIRFDLLHYFFAGRKLG